MPYDEAAVAAEEPKQVTFDPILAPIHDGSPLSRLDLPNMANKARQNETPQKTQV
jgi:hypothetical protein